MFEAGQSVDDIISCIENDQVFDDLSIRQQFESEIKKLVERERFCDISISDYIIDHYKMKKVFYDPNHPAKEVIWELGKRILKLLGIQEPAFHINTDANDCGEIFIYGCVRESLGLEFDQKYIKKCQHDNSLHDRPITLREYVGEYIDWHYPLSME